MHLRKTKECCFPYRALQLQTFGEGSLLGVHQLINIYSGWTCRRNKGILMIRTLSRFLFVLVLFLFCFVFVFLLLLAFFVALQSCKNMAGKNCTPKYERSK